MLTQVLSNFEPIRRAILTMLKPIDIVSLVLATRLMTTTWERSNYLNLFRQVFSNATWVEKIRESGGTVSLVGGDSSNLEVYVMFTNRNMRIALDALWTNQLLYNIKDLNQVKDTESLSPEAVRNVRNYTWYSNLHESTPIVEQTPLSHNTLWGVSSVLREHGEEDKFLLQCAKYKGWTYVATRHGVALTLTN